MVTAAIVQLIDHREAAPKRVGHPGAEQPPEDRDQADPDHQIRCVGRVDLQHQHQQRRQPQRQPDGAGLADAGQAGHDQAARVFEHFAPHGVLDLARPSRAIGSTPGSTCNAQARDWRASSRRPLPISQCGDSGTQARISRVSSGRHQAHHEQAAPADGGLQERARHGAQQRAGRQQAGGQPGDPAALIGRHEFLHDRDIDGVQTGHAHADEEPADRQEQPAVFRGECHRAGGDGEVQHGEDHDAAPADLVGHPAPEQRAKRRADAGREQDRSRLAVGQMPAADDEREHEADQIEVEEIEHVADHRRGEDLPLIRRSATSAAPECSNIPLPPSRRSSCLLWHDDDVARGTYSSPRTAFRATFDGSAPSVKGECKRPDQRVQEKSQGLRP